MLVLSRKTSQRIQIGDSVVVTVVKIAGNVVRLGIEAPRETPIVREELDPCLSELPPVNFSDRCVTRLVEVSRKV